LSNSNGDNSLVKLGVKPQKSYPSVPNLYEATVLSEPVFGLAMENDWISERMKSRVPKRWIFALDWGCLRAEELNLRIVRIEALHLSML
jgi:hypothetical protein